MSNKYTPEEVNAISNFNPYLVYVIRKRALQELLLNTPRPFAFYDGRSYQVSSKHIGAGVYEVTGKFID